MFTETWFKIDFNHILSNQPEYRLPVASFIHPFNHEATSSTHLSLHSVSQYNQSGKRRLQAEHNIHHLYKADYKWLIREEILLSPSTNMWGNLITYKIH